MPIQTEEKPFQDVKYTCPNCGFENYIAGYCPSCEEDYLRKVCECESGKYAAQCCEPELEEIEKKMREEATKEAEREGKKELDQEIKSEIYEEKAEDKIFEEAKKEAEKLGE